MTFGGSRGNPAFIEDLHPFFDGNTAMVRDGGRCRSSHDLLVPFDSSPPVFPSKLGSRVVGTYRSPRAAVRATSPPLPASCRDVEKAEIAAQSEVCFKPPACRNRLLIGQCALPLLMVKVYITSAETS